MTSILIEDLTSELAIQAEENYEQIPKSEILPDLDLTLLAQYAIQPNPLEAILGFREVIRQQ